MNMNTLYFHFRFCAVVHVLFYTLAHFLNDQRTSEGLFIPDEVDEQTAKTVLHLVQYFSQQRVIINKVELKT